MVADHSHWMRYHTTCRYWLHAFSWTLGRFCSRSGDKYPDFIRCRIDVVTFAVAVPERLFMLVLERSSNAVGRMGHFEKSEEERVVVFTNPFASRSIVLKS